MRRLLALAAFLLAALPVHAQSITVQNPSFENVTGITFTSYPGGPYSTGQPIPSWTITGSSGAGLWQPNTTEYSSVPNGTTIAYSNGSTISQDLGVAAQASTTYTLLVYVGRRNDVYGNTNAAYTAQMSIGSTLCAAQSGNINDIAPGTFIPVAVTCFTNAAPPAGDLIISMAASGSQADFDNVSLTSGTAFTFKLTGLGTLSFPMQGDPSCTTADGTCSIQLKACNTKTNVCVTLNPGDTGTFVVLKQVTLPSVQTQSTTVVTAGP